MTCQDILLIMQITMSQAEVYEKLNQFYLLESKGTTLGESTPPNHRRQQLNGLLRSTPELDHQPCTGTASNCLAALNPRVRNKLHQESFHAALSLRVRNKIQQESFHAALSLRVCNKLSDGLMKWEKHSIHAFIAKFLHAQHGVPCYSSALI